MRTSRLHHRLRRNSANAVAAGVCAGLADYWRTDATLVRVGAVVFGVLFTKIAIISYAAAWLLLDD